MTKDVIMRNSCIKNKQNYYSSYCQNQKICIDKCSPLHRQECAKVHYMDDLLLKKDIPEMCTVVDRWRKIRKKDPEDKDYPAMMVSCCVSPSNSSLKIYTKHSCKPLKKFYKNTSLITEMELLGKIGKGSKICANPVGQCAEQHAAEMLLRDNPTYPIKKILFSTAFRPRTNEAFDYCDNCIKIFNI